MLKRRKELEAEVRPACTGEAAGGLAQRLWPPIGVDAAAGWGLELQTNGPNCATTPTMQRLA
jgi:hypothetical protein